MSEGSLTPVLYRVVFWTSMIAVQKKTFFLVAVQPGDELISQVTTIPRHQATGIMQEFVKHVVQSV